MGIKAGTLEIEFLTNMARLQGELTQIKRSVGDTMGEAVAQHNQLVRTSQRLTDELEREAATFGKTAVQIRQMDAAAKALQLEEAGLTAQAERLRVAQQRVTEAHDTGTKSLGLNRMQVLTAQSAVIRFSDALMSGMSPLKAFALEAHKGVEVMSMDEGGFGGGLAKIGGMALAIAAPLAVAGVAFWRWEKQLSDGSGLKAYADQLGLTKKQIEDAGGATVTVGDIIKGVWKTLSSDLQSEFGSGGKRLIDYLFAPTDAQQIGQFVASIYATFVGGYHGIVATWKMLPDALGDAVVQLDNKVIAAVEYMVNKAIGALNGFASGANGLLHMDLFGQIEQVQLPRLQDSAAGTAAKVGKVMSDSYKAAYDQAWKYEQGFVARSGAAALQNARQRLDDAAGKGKEDKHAEELARAAAAEEAQIKNLYKLADAYGVSGGAALIAEAREKAESKAIKDRGDIAAETDRQIRLAIAQRVADAAKSTASMNEQATVQDRVNTMVEAGLVPQAKAAEMVRDMIALLPLLAAQQAAQQDGDRHGYEEATKAIAAETAAQDRLNAAKAAAALDQDKTSTNNQQAQLEAELRLIGATDAARVHELATIKAVQDAQAAQLTAGTADYDDFIRRHVQLADATQVLTEAQAQYNEHVRVAATLADSLADSMSKSFGRVGSAIGGAIKILGEYGAKQAEIDKQVKAGTLSQAAGVKASADLQMTSLIGLTDAAKSLFSEHSKGYKAMEAAEKALTIIQLARTAVDVAGGAARMFASLGPFAFPAVAAMLGVMASLGFGGGGSSSYKPETNTGTGTVLGDSSAQSDSIRRAIQDLGDIDHSTMVYSSEMLTALKSIDSKIAAASALIARSDTSQQAAAGINTGSISSGAIKSTAVDAGAAGAIGLVLGGPIGGAIGLVIGGLIGSIVNGLFGTTKKVVGTGLYGSAQTLGSIEDSGYSLSDYADIQKKKHFLGITTSTSYSTQYSAADPTLQSQFTLILQSFYKAIDATAEPLGLATGDVEDRLNNFVVDIGKIDLTGLSGDDVEKKLEAVFGAAADNIAQAAVPGLERFQLVGEGYFETLTRVASTVEAVTQSLGEIGIGTSGLDIDAKMGVASQFDSVSAMQSATDAYFTTFFSDAEQTAAKTAQLGQVFNSLGLTLPDSIASYRQLVDAQDLTTDAGQQTYAELIKLAPAFAQVATSTQSATNAAAILREQQDLQQQLYEAEGDTASLRAIELAKLDPSNRALQQRIYDLQDEQAATQAASEAAQAAAQAEQAIASERAGLMQQLWQLTGDTASQRAATLAGLDDSNRALQQQIWSLQDQAAATDAATKAAQDAAAAEQAVANERDGIAKQLLQLQGNTAAIRAEELAGLDASNRALQQQVYDLTDQQAAIEAASQAAADAAAKEQAIADERAGLQDQVYQLLGDTAALRGEELAKLDSSNRALQQRIYDLTDEQAAMQAASQAAQDAAAKEAAIATERAGLEEQLLQLQGDTTALRALDLAKLDASNQALQQQIWALTDQAAATEAATQAAAAAAQQEQAIASERAGLQQQLYQLLGDTASLRAAELDKLDPSNRALQERIYALTDQQAADQAAAQAAQEAAQAADQLRQAWASIGDSITDEVRRIRGLTSSTSDSYASLLAQFNDATLSARAGDQDAAKLLPDLSKSLLDAAAEIATSGQELGRIQGMTAASLDDTLAVIAAGAFSANDNTPQSQAWWPGYASNQAATASSADASDGLVAEVRNLRAEVAGLRDDQRTANAQLAAPLKSIDKTLTNVSGGTGGDAVTVEVRAA